MEVFEMAAHALLSPSKSHQWIPCPGSIALEHQLGVDKQDSSSEFADQGTAAHTLAARCLTENVDAVVFLGKWYITVGNEDGSIRRGFDCDSEMTANVQVYLDEVRSRVGPGDTLLVEQRVSLERTMGMTGQGGTADAIILHADGGVTVIDLKYGAGVKVYVEGNTQALSYGCGVLETFDMVYDFTRIKLVIVQPRMDNIAETEWLPISDLEEHGRKMRDAALKVNVALMQVADGSPIGEVFFAPSKKACQWCKAKHACDALLKVATEEIAAEFDVLPGEQVVEAAALPDNYPGSGRPTNLGKAYAALPILQMWMESVREEVNRQVRGGMRVDGPDGLPLKLVDGGFGHRKWKDETAAEAALVGVLPPDKAYKPREIITAPQAAKLLDKKKTAAQWAMFEHLVTKAPKQPIVVLGSDPRPVYSGDAIAEEFETLSVTE
jgi:hypothetical protein